MATAWWKSGQGTYKPRKFGAPGKGFPIQEDEMSQILNVAPGKYLTFDRSWRDNGDDAQYALIGGQKVLIKEGGRAKPEIFQRGSGFYYKDGSPVTDIGHVAWLPKKFRDLAEKFVKSNDGEAPVLKPVPTREAAVVQAVKRGRGRPKRVVQKGPIEIKDAESLAAVLGDGEDR